MGRSAISSRLLVAVGLIARFGTKPNSSECLGRSVPAMGSDKPSFISILITLFNPSLARWEHLNFL